MSPSALEIAQQLENSPLFKGVDLPNREALVQAMQYKQYPRGHILFEKGSPGDSIYIILSGRVRIFTTDKDGQSFTIRHLYPPNTFGEFTVLDRKPRSASAEAADPLEAMVLSREVFLGFLHERPLVGLSMMRNLVERVRYTTKFLQQVMQATERLSEGDFTVRQISGEGSDAEIQNLIDAYMKMMQSVQQKLQHPPGASDAE
jgi:CRP/FNR family transcriptional regulator, cyclic AMP receptor protein